MQWLASSWRGEAHWELEKSGECALALEELCNYLGEHPQHRPSDLLARIASLGAIFKVDPSYWQPLTGAPTIKTLNATIRFLTSVEGGRSTPAEPGIRPQIKLGQVFTSCTVQPLVPVPTFKLGDAYDVKIEIQFWNEYGHLFRDEHPVELFEGSRLIARGVWSRG